MVVRIIILFSLLFTVSSCNQKPPAENDNERMARLYSILELKDIINIQKNDSLNNILEDVESDSIKKDLLLKISRYYMRTDEPKQFKSWNEKSRKQSFKMNDSIGVADSYWDAALFYGSRDLQDSSFLMYSKAYSIYERLNQPKRAGRLLINMALIQMKIKDYTAGEISNAKAIEHLKGSGDNQWLYYAYNNLGIIYVEIKEYEKAIHHYNLAFDHIEKIRNRNKFPYFPNHYNNIGVLHQYNNDNKKAIKFFNKALSSDSLRIISPELFAMALDNRAYSKVLLKDTTGVQKSFNQALRIRDSIEHTAGIIINKIHLSEFYAFKQDTAKAIALATEAKILANETSNNKNILASLKLLSVYDTKNAKKYLDEYITLSDSLQQTERSLRNKFTKIKFDTDQYIAKNEELSGQRNLFIGISLGIALLGISGFVIKNQRTKNRELGLKQEQQEANEKVLKLLLNQHSLKEEGRQKERKRLSEEIHDGILSKLFGLRLSLTSLNSKSDDTSVQQREKYLKDLKVLSNELRHLSHKLNAPFFTAEFGYLSILEEVLSDQTENSFSYNLKVDEDIDWDSIPGNIKLHFLRILQESVKNIRQHSRANEVRVTIGFRKDQLVLLTQDNGIGFDTSILTEGIGLKNMQSRTRELNGIFNIKSKVNQGTEIRIEIPL
ncbi:tetratricopeptide repeat protein [Salegentibacter sp. LM13S]|uniref:tetratricopeptide repeat-containing sensor histidine kinase n=1 Tax=Salegentibacter lacus TaxID=2873599 RepID=UPI001CCC36AA|nr:tetratricopeptide repeat-containing sensor histidine kinase [Salegentibacter lacus]MBZ9629733.1 tetratricopeptide repeat protein [Salegentibacter lacus]